MAAIPHGSDMYIWVTPTDAEEAIVRRALVDVVASGYRLPPSLRVGWFWGQDYEPWGITFSRERPIVILFRTGTGNPASELRRTAYHEVGHVLDSAYASYPDMPQDERETRAEAFAQRMMRGARYGAP